MRITSLIGLTERERDVARAEYKRETAQLTEIIERYEMRRLRRDIYAKAVAEFAERAERDGDDVQARRLWQRLDDMSDLNCRDFQLQRAALDRRFELWDKWDAMENEDWDVYVAKRGGLLARTRELTA